MINKEKIDIIIDVFKPYQPDMIGIFGSFARNDNTKESDLDILYSLPVNTISLFEHIKIIHLLETKLNMNIDMVSDKAVHPELKPSIYKDLKVIYEC